MPWNKGSEKFSQFMRDQWNQGKRRENASANMKKLWQTTDHRDKVLPIAEGRHAGIRNTKIEVKLQRLLSRNGLKFEAHQYIGHTTITDISFPTLKVAVFADGCYFHLCPIHFKGNETLDSRIDEDRPIKDERINKVLASEGWLVLRYWEHELNDPAKLKEIEAQILDAVELRTAKLSRSGRWLE